VTYVSAKGIHPAFAWFRILGCCFEMLACSAQFEQVRTCFVFGRRAACNHVQLLFVQFDELGLVADFLLDDPVIGPLAKFYKRA
jgi:hypothetical protein